MKKVRLGIVGCGSRGVWIGSLFKQHPQCEVTALVDPYEKILKAAAAKLDVPGLKVYTRFEAMLKDAPVDALFIACDPMEQVGYACLGMHAGKHVCTEVPAAFSLDECWSLVSAVEKTGVKYQLMEQTRYWGFVDAWKQMHDRGEFGHMCLAQGEYVHYERNWGYWKDARSGEVLNDLTKPAGRKVKPTWRRTILTDPIYYLPHTLSPLLKILDDRVVRVSCMSTQPMSYTYPEGSLPWRDIEYALMHTAKDTVLLVGAGFSLPSVPRGPAHAHWYELRGTKATVTSPRHASDRFRIWRPGMAEFETMDLSTVPLGADAAAAASGHGGADFKPVDTFIRAILDDTPPPMDVYLALETAAPAILAAESARVDGETVLVPDFRPEARTH